MSRISQNLVEKVMILRRAAESVHGPRADVGSPEMCLQLTTYAGLLAAQGCVGTAYNYLGNTSNNVRCCHRLCSLITILLLISILQTNVNAYVDVNVNAYINVKASVNVNAYINVNAYVNVNAHINVKAYVNVNAL